jgi:hypothetical protein
MERLQNPKSAVSGTHFVAMSAHGSRVVVWSAVTGSVYSEIEVGSQIGAFALDEEFGGWFVTESELFAVSLGGEIVCQTRIENKITALAAVQLGPTKERSVIVGVKTGEVGLVRWNGLEELEWKWLMSEHRAPIRWISVAPLLNGFLTVDDRGGGYAWHLMNARSPWQLDKRFTPCCCTCLSPAIVHYCSSCGRTHCFGCWDVSATNEDGLCCLCSGYSSFL